MNIRKIMTDRSILLRSFKDAGTNKIGKLWQAIQPDKKRLNSNSQPKTRGHIKNSMVWVLNNTELMSVCGVGAFAVLWFIYPKIDRFEPAIALVLVAASALAFKKRNVDDSIKKKISNSDPIKDWYCSENNSNTEYSAVFKKEPGIKIVQYMEAENPDFKEPWLEGLYPDSSTKSHKVSIQFNGNELISRTVLIVDGGRAHIPMPKSSTKLETNNFDKALCQILGAQSGYDTAYYFRQAKFKIT